MKILRLSLFNLKKNKREAFSVMLLTAMTILLMGIAVCNMTKVNTVFDEMFEAMQETLNEAKQEFYIDWKDVKHIKFNIFITGSLSPPAIDVVSRIFGRGYYHPTALSYCKFASLAKYYSGRKDVVMLWKKRKLFEKDW